ncbi:hypothetical protein NM688_g4810 [Phlebia brevispora]|uniref:Uncharacterized protein n=1 Tax=Phlebia brevispora TaxID=194682 RepID=A0ACC1T1X8_9APHY|nr:hypothetical protein NM688_g4810 [Phlebia brevispora]
MFSLRTGLSAVFALALTFSSGVKAQLESGNYTIYATGQPKSIMGTLIQPTPVTSTVSNLDDFAEWPAEWYTWTITKLPGLPNNYTFMLNGRYSLLGLPDIYLGQDVSEEETQVWSLEQSPEFSNQYKILTADGTKKWAFPALIFPTVILQVHPVAPDSTEYIPGQTAVDLFEFDPA